MSMSRVVIARARGEAVLDVSLIVVPLAGNSLERWYTIRCLKFRGGQLQDH